MTSETLLLSVVTPLALGEDRLLRLLVLSHLELLMLVAVGTVSPAGFWDVDLKCSTTNITIMHFANINNVQSSFRETKLNINKLVLKTLTKSISICLIIDK